MRNAMIAAKRDGRLREQSAEEIFGVSVQKFFGVLYGWKIPTKMDGKIRRRKAYGKN